MRPEQKVYEIRPEMRMTEHEIRQISCAVVLREFKSKQQRDYIDSLYSRAIEPTADKRAHISMWKLLKMEDPSYFGRASRWRCKATVLNWLAELNRSRARMKPDEAAEFFLGEMNSRPVGMRVTAAAYSKD